MKKCAVYIKQSASRATVYQDDVARPRMETRYVVTNGIATIVGRTWTRYTRINHDGYAAIKHETWRDMVGRRVPTPPPTDAAYPVVCRLCKRELRNLFSA